MSLAVRLGLWCVAVLVFALLSDAASAETETQEVSMDETLLREEIEKLLQLWVGSGDVINLFDPNGCHCRGLTCNCCKHIKIRQIGIDTDCCISVRYLRWKIGIRVTGTIGKHVIFNQEISARNPPRLCFGLPFWSKRAKVCMKFYNIEVRKHQVAGCGKLSFTFLGITVYNLDIGCFRMNFLDQGTALEQSFVEPYTPLKTNLLPFDEEVNVLPMEEIEQPTGAGKK